MSNQKVLYQLQSGGDNLSKERQVDHWIYFADKGSKIDFKKAKNNLTERAKKRRSKVLSDKLVDFLFSSSVKI